MGQQVFDLLKEKSTPEASEERKLKIQNDKNSRDYVDGGFDMLHSGHFNAIR